jgi:hypothetical protein
VSIEDRSSGPGEQDWVVYWCIWAIWNLGNWVASTVTELDNPLPRFTDDRRDSVRVTHGLPDEVFTWKTTLERGRTRPDSLTVIAKGGHSCCLCGSRVLCCQVISVARWLLIRISATPSNMGEVCSLLSFRRSDISLCSYDIYGYVKLWLLGSR